MSEQAAAPAREQLMTRRFELDGQIEECQRVTEAALEPLVAELQQTEQAIKQSMIDGGEQQVKMADGSMCFFTTKSSVTVEDMDATLDYMLKASPLPVGPEFAMIQDAATWDRILNHIHATAMFGLLNNAVSKKAAVEIIEANGSLPGVKFSSFKDLSWRRGKQA